MPGSSDRTVEMFWYVPMEKRECLMQADVARCFMVTLLNPPQVRGLLSSEHFSVDGTLIDCWASMKSFVIRYGSGEPPSAGRKGERNLRKEKRSNATRASTADPDAQLFRKGDDQSSRLYFMGHALMENRNGLIVDCELTGATGTAKRSRRTGNRTVRRARVTLGAGKARRPPSMAIPRGTKAMRSASAAANALKRASPEPRPSAALPGSKSRGLPGQTLSSRLR
jgi:hypothetical protein